MNTETIKEIDVQSVMTKSALPVGGYSVNPLRGMPSRLQVLLRIVYETLHRAYRTVGRVSGREELETDSQSAQI